MNTGNMNPTNQVLTLMLVVCFVGLTGLTLIQQWTLNERGPVIDVLTKFQREINNVGFDRWHREEAKELNNRQRDAWEELREIHPGLPPWPMLEPTPDSPEPTPDSEPNQPIPTPANVGERTQ